MNVAKLIIESLTGRSTQTEAFFGPVWMEENKVDIAAARRQHENAKALLLELQQVQSEPDSDFVNYDVELMRGADERGDDDVESREEIGE